MAISPRWPAGRAAAMSLEDSKAALAADERAADGVCEVTLVAHFRMPRACPAADHGLGRVKEGLSHDLVVARQYGSYRVRLGGRLENELTCGVAHLRQRWRRQRLDDRRGCDVAHRVAGLCAFVRSCVTVTGRRGPV